MHGDSPLDVPEGIRADTDRALGDAYAAAGLARMNVVKLGSGYRDGGGASDDRDYPTRLGQPTRALLLARQPWAEGASRAEAELLSEVSARAPRFRGLGLPDQSAPEIAAFTEGWPDWKRASLTVCPVGEDGWICEGLRYDPRLGLLFAPGAPG